MQVRLFAVLSAGFLGMYGVSVADSAFNYVETPATVVESRLDCFIASGSRKHVDEVTGKLAEIDCALAPMVAASLGYQPEDVKQRVKFTYQYVSPADASLQLFQTHADSDFDRYSPGTSLLISAHSSEPRSHRFD